MENESKLKKNKDDICFENENDFEKAIEEMKVKIAAIEKKNQEGNELNHASVKILN